jgi:hypothetical protein
VLNTFPLLCSGFFPNGLTGTIKVGTFLRTPSH